jgi:hypothetical protein
MPFRPTVLVLDPVPLNATHDDTHPTAKSEPNSELYLRPGKYRLTYTDQENIMLYQQDITVTADSSAPPAPDPG